MKRLLTVIVMVVAVVGVSAGGSVAGVKKIWADELIPENSTDVYIQNTHEVYSGDSTNAWFYARVKLPLGKVLKKLTFYYPNWSSTSTQVRLIRKALGENIEMLAIADSANTGSGGRLVAEDDTIIYAKIKKGFAYYVRVYSQNSNGRISGIEITYK